MTGLYGFSSTVLRTATDSARLQSGKDLVFEEEEVLSLFVCSQLSPLDHPVDADTGPTQENADLIGGKHPALGLRIRLEAHHQGVHSPAEASDFRHQGCHQLGHLIECNPRLLHGIVSRFQPGPSHRRPSPPYRSYGQA